MSDRPSEKPKKQRAEAPFPTKEQVLEFIRESPTPVGKREIARAFHLSGDRKIPLKALLKEIERDGLVDRGRGRRIAAPGALPAVAIIEVVGPDTDGELIARPTRWEDAGPAPRIVVRPERDGLPALAPRERLLAKLERHPDGVYSATIMRRLPSLTSARVLGIVERQRDGSLRLKPTDKRQKHELAVMPADAADAVEGEIVVAEVLPATRLGLRRARITERIGHIGAPRAISLLAIHSADIPTVFPEAALEQAERALPAPLAGRDDIRDIPLVTIDGRDARDFDDAVFAEPDPEVAGGWHIVVAIADVAHYVTSGSPLDKEAFLRGNSAYFPDRVVPMLPEALSNDLCSLRPDEDRACLAVHMWIDAGGQLTRHRFLRGLMRSRARLTYEQVQEAMDGGPDEHTSPLLDPIIRPLYGAFRALLAARKSRGTLDLDVPERKVELDAEGRVVRIDTRARFDSHRLIEEFMICANVAAAQALEARSTPLLYRIHDQPGLEKLENLRQFLGGMGYKLPTGKLAPEHFLRILERAEGRPEQFLVNELVLRSQAQAVYGPENVGHFGLALSRYAHFTSPIRHYADLIVHRALIRAYGLGADGLTDDEIARLPAIGEHISVTERRAAAAERDAVERYAAAFLAERVGAFFPARVSGVTRFGLFVRLEEVGADGLVPISTLPRDYYNHDEAQHALIGERTGRTYRLGQMLRVRLVEADPTLGSLSFVVAGDEAGGDDAAEPQAGANRRASVISRMHKRRRRDK
ncbi:MAG TPA: ribonuclease R [Alphaproteobacteria bacterium]|nr:ribonuclease R [Alphaproteobacteria bacterium]